MFLTIESARLPCCTTLSRLPCSISAISLISCPQLCCRGWRPPSASRNSSMSSTEMAEKLLTKLSGFLISCAIPAVSWPSEASFSVCTRRSCAVRNSSSDFASSRVRASTLSNSRTFSIAITAWSAKVETSSICLSVNGRTSRRVKIRTPIGRSLAQHRNAEHRAIIRPASAPRERCIPGQPVRRGYERVALQAAHARIADRGPA